MRSTGGSGLPPPQLRCFRRPRQPACISSPPTSNRKFDQSTPSSHRSRPPALPPDHDGAPQGRDAQHPGGRARADRRSHRSGEPISCVCWMGWRLGWWVRKGADRRKNVRASMRSKQAGWAPRGTGAGLPGFAGGRKAHSWVLKLTERGCRVVCSSERAARSCYLRWHRYQLVSLAAAGARRTGRTR